MLQPSASFEAAELLALTEPQLAALVAVVADDTRIKTELCAQLK